jgi:LysR substrate binding domain
MAASASTVISRKDFGLTWNAALETGGVLVGDEVTIDLDVQFVKSQAWGYLSRSTFQPEIGGARRASSCDPRVLQLGAGQRFFERCVATVEGAQEAELRREPAGLVRLGSPVLLTQRCLAHALPGYMTVHPKVSVFVEATDRTVNVIEERFDIAIRAKPEIEDVAGLVAKTLGNPQRVLVVRGSDCCGIGRAECEGTAIR